MWGAIWIVGPWLAWCGLHQVGPYDVQGGWKHKADRAGQGRLQDRLLQADTDVGELGLGTGTEVGDTKKF